MYSNTPSRLEMPGVSSGTTIPGDGQMKSFYGVTLLVALVATPLVLEAQVAGQQRDAQPFAMILGQREALGLSQAQVDRLQAIGQRLQEQNAPLMEQMRASGVLPEARRPGQRQPAMQRPPAEHRDSMRARMQRNQQNMTPEQRQQMRQQMRTMAPEQRQQMRERMSTMTPEQRQQMHERMRTMTPEQREAMRSQMQGRQAEARQVPEALRPVMEQARANRQAAMQEARAVLTPEQQTRMQELAQQRRGQMGERMNRRPSGR
jgi:hypothetical protein